MLDEAEFAEAQRLYALMFDNRRSGISRAESAQPLLDYFNQLTGFGETEPNAIMYHRISQYGPACGTCGKPYRTPLATICVACGGKRNTRPDPL